MDGAPRQNPYGLEDRLRNMILSQPPSNYVEPPPPQELDHQFQTKPTVRLPPPGPSAPTVAPVFTPNDWRSTGQPAYGAQPQLSQQGPTYNARNQGYNAPSGFSPRYHGGHYNPAGQGRGTGYVNQPVNPNAFQRRVPPSFDQHPQQRRQLYQPGSQGPRPGMQGQYLRMQADYLESVAAAEVPLVEMSHAERDEKEAFRQALQQVCDDLHSADPERLPKVSIECFGSFASGFASAGSDMDLVTVVQGADSAAACFSVLEDDLPRVLERRLLQLGYGARLLTRTRVPIIKVCQKPDSSLLSKLWQEREKWDSLDNEKKYPHLHKDEDEHAEDDLGPVAQGPTEAPVQGGASSTSERPSDAADKIATSSAATTQTDPTLTSESTEKIADKKATANEAEAISRPKREPWTRERKGGPLDFPKDGVGVQSDINFFNPLGIHNTQMLHCYSLCDPRVRPMVLFVKAWAKRRKINSSYSGTLSSYGYVLMVLHYLMNIASPAVLPNLQLSWRPHGGCTPHGADRTAVDGWEVDFWRREEEIIAAAQQGVLTRNQSSLGQLLTGFFTYYSSQGGFPSFHWMGDVLSLRTPGGLQTKEEKGWVKAVTEQGEGKQVQHRYLFCIEDPFELQHNVARTVTHNGIVAIRDEFRRANRLLRGIGNGIVPGGVGSGMWSREGLLFDELVEHPPAEPVSQPGVPDSAFQTQRPAPPMQHNTRNNLPRGPPATNARLPDVKDNDAFPALGSAKPAPAPAAKRNNAASRKRTPQTNLSSGEISGEKAKAYLEELKRKKAGEEKA